MAACTARPRAAAPLPGSEAASAAPKPGRGLLPTVAWHVAWAVLLLLLQLLLLVRLHRTLLLELHSSCSALGLCPLGSTSPSAVSATSSTTLPRTCPSLPSPSQSSPAASVPLPSLPSHSSAVAPGGLSQSCLRQIRTQRARLPICCRHMGQLTSWAIQRSAQLPWKTCRQGNCSRPCVGRTFVASAGAYASAASRVASSSRQMAHSPGATSAKSSHSMSLALGAFQSSLRTLRPILRISAASCTRL
mmetsp:Transcript_13910/g.39744  ORF Transcript_13910/g.39744 Transcript_13910/m.39744 type:complete len:247 (+) Transcript_13910:153-893(+)